MKRRKERFTLIELLAVIAIASVLMGLFVPAFSRMMKGSKVDQMASNLKLGLELAQSKAIAARKYVALVLPNNYAKCTDEKLKRFCGGGYRMAYVRKNGSDWDFLGWVPGSDWSNPADNGAMIVRITNASSITDANTKPAQDKTSRSISTTLPVFDGASNLSTLANVSGEADFTALGGASDIALIFSPYGGVVNDTNQPVGFAMTGSVVSPDGDECRYENVADYLILRVNAITGRVDYVAIPEE